MIQVDQARRAWFFTLDAHLRAAERHDACAHRFAMLGDAAGAEQEVERAAAERLARARAMAEHPERVR
jgi:hypothetical protein